MLGYWLEKFHIGKFRKPCNVVWLVEDYSTRHRSQLVSGRGGGGGGGGSWLGIRKKKIYESQVKKGKRKKLKFQKRAQLVVEVLI